MIPKELLRKIRRIQIRTSHVVNDAMAGQYHSAFKGRGMEFEEVRQYVPGDDVRTIDWNVTARAGSPFVKVFREERELTVILLVDVSRSHLFGTARQLKRDLAAELCAVLAFSAVRNNDKIGLTCFTDQIEKFVPPKKGTRHVLRVIRELLYIQPHGVGTSIARALDHLNRVIRRRAVVFLVSDFQSSGYERPLSVARRRHDLMPVIISDRREIMLPNVGLVELFDAETGASVVADTASRSLRGAYKQKGLATTDEQRSLFSRLEMDAIDVRTGEDFIKPLMTFFRAREARL